MAGVLRGSRTDGHRSRDQAHSALAVLLGLAVAGVFGVAPGFRRDELECEEAIAHLRGCCGDTAGLQVSCEYSVGCHGTCYPDLDTAESEWLMELDCSEVRERGLCTDYSPGVQSSNGGNRGQCVEDP